MTSLRIDSTSALDTSDFTLRAAPARMLAFLQGAAEPQVGRLLAKKGWCEQEVKSAWALLASLNEIPQASPAQIDPFDAAIAACEAFHDETLVCAKAFLQLGYPAQYEFLLHDYTPCSGLAAAVAVSTFISRRAEMMSGSSRKASRKLDREALEAMAKAGVNNTEIARLLRAVHTTQQPPDETVPVDRNQVRRRDTLRKIHAWNVAWSDVARTVVTRRVDLIRLGIAKRRAPKSRAVLPPVTAPVVPIVAPVTPVVSPAPAPAPAPAPSPAPVVAESIDVAPPSRAA